MKFGKHFTLTVLMVFVALLLPFLMIENPKLGTEIICFCNAIAMMLLGSYVIRNMKACSHLPKVNPKDFHLELISNIASGMTPAIVVVMFGVMALTPLAIVVGLFQHMK